MVSSTPRNLPVGCVLGWIYLKDWIVTKLGCYFFQPEKHHEPPHSDTEATWEGPSDVMCRQGTRVDWDHTPYSPSASEWILPTDMAGKGATVWGGGFEKVPLRDKPVMGALNFALQVCTLQEGEHANLSHKGPRAHGPLTTVQAHFVSSPGSSDVLQIKHQVCLGWRFPIQLLVLGCPCMCSGEGALFPSWQGP